MIYEMFSKYTYKIIIYVLLMTYCIEKKNMIKTQYTKHAVSPPPQVVLHSVNSLYIQLYPLDNVCFTALVGMLYSYSIPGLTS